MLYLKLKSQQDKTTSHKHVGQTSNTIKYGHIRCNINLFDNFYKQTTQKYTKLKPNITNCFYSTDSASVTVHVIKGEHSAAMHHEEGNISSIASTMDLQINKFQIVSFGLTTIFTINNLFLNFFRNENHLLPSAS